MTKLIVSIIVSFMVILGLGLWETILIENKYDDLRRDLTALVPKAKDESITPADFEPVLSKWEEYKTFSEIFLTHSDLNEVNMRINECKSFIEIKEYSSAYMQLNVLIELTVYIPRTVCPSLRNII